MNNFFVYNEMRRNNSKDRVVSRFCGFVFVLRKEIQGFWQGESYEFYEKS